MAYRCSRDLPNEERYGITQQAQARRRLRGIDLADENSRMLAVMIRKMGRKTPKR